MTAIFVDAPADISAQIGRQLDIQILPVQLQFAGETILSNNITAQELLARVQREKQIPTTATIGPDRYAEIYRQALVTHDNVISIHFTSRLSQSFAEAQRAATQFGDRVRVIDSGIGSFAQGMQAIRAARMRDDGYSAEEIVAELQRIQGRQFMHFMVDTLDHLRMTGRVSGATAFFGNLLGMRPLLKYENGEVVASGRARGQQRALEALGQQLVDYAPTIEGQLHLAFVYTPGGEGKAQELQQIVTSMGYQSMGLYELGAVQTAVSGPGAVGLAAEPMLQHSRHRARAKL